MTYLIERRRFRAGKHQNSVPIVVWRSCGYISAGNSQEALEAAQRVTGAAVDDVRVSTATTRLRE